MKLTTRPRLTLTTNGEFVDRPTYEIPRDIKCYYCRRGEHTRCALPRTCACYTCFPASVRGAQS
jgi:hypothetical protein